MAAPGNVYEGSLLNGSVPFAKRLIEYGSQIKELFYLDALIGSDRPGDPFVGLIINDTTSKNYKLHNDARHFNARITVGGVSYIALNDGGLNTRSFAKINSTGVAFANYIKVNSTFDAAYYSDTTEIGYQIRLAGSGSWGSLLPKAGVTITKKTSRTATDIIAGGFTEPGTYEYRAYAINEEGTFYGDTQSVYANSAIAFINATKRVNACDLTGTSTDLYMLQSKYDILNTVTISDAATGIYIYLDEAMTIPATGYFADMIALEPEKVFYVPDSTGMISRYVECTIVPPEDDNFQTLVTKTGTTYYAAILLNQVRATDVTVTGTIKSMDPSSSEVIGITGDGSFSITVLAGTLYNDQATTIVPIAIPDPYDHLLAVVSTAAPVTPYTQTKFYEV